MGKLTVFNFLSLNGYISGPNHDISWHKQIGAEDENDLGVSGLNAGGALVFGRITYMMMASFWPTPAAHQQMPEMADGMNKARKFVFSKTLASADWKNTTLLTGKLIDEIKKLKQSDSTVTILGSGSIVTQCAEHNLIDEYQFLVDPVALGSGTQAFKDMKHYLELTLKDCKVFKSGAVLLTYHAK